MKKHSLDGYIVPKDEEIKFDEHGRPYTQSIHGRIMLSRKQDDYNYKIAN
jgi:hypothetical protein